MSLISIITTTLNSEKFLSRSIESCLNQTHQDLELIMVDGGSNDRTLEIIRSFDDPRIRLIHQPDNTGKLPGAINLGMAEANGDFFTWTQDDVYYESDAIETMVSFLNNYQDVALVYTDYWDVDDKSNLIRYQRVNPPEDILIDDVVRVCFLFRREIFDSIGPQNTKYHPVHERPWRIKVAQRFNLKPLHVPLMYYAVHPDSLTGRIGGWTLQRMTANVFLQEGYFDNRLYRKELARIDINQAYDAFIFQCDFVNFRKLSLLGVFRNPALLLNRGLWKMWLISLHPSRVEIQESLLEKWVAKDKYQQELMIYRNK